MPLTFSGVLAITQLTTSTAARPVKASALVALAVSAPVGVDEDTVMHEIQLSVWPDDSRSTTVPNVDQIYFVEGKLSFMVPEPVLIIEVSRMVLMPQDTPPFPPRIIGTAITVTKEEKMLTMQTNSYAASHTSNEVRVLANFSATQYAKFLSTLALGKEIHFAGLLSGVFENHIHVLNTELSYLSKPLPASLLPTPAKPKTWPTKRGGISPCTPEDDGRRKQQRLHCPSSSPENDDDNSSACFSVTPVKTGKRNSRKQ